MPVKSLAIVGWLLLLSFTACAQGWPSKIRGYKVYDPKITLGVSADDKDKNAILKLVNFEIVNIGLSGATIEITSEVTTKKQGGDIEFVTFHDFKIDATPVEIEEYKTPFRLKKGVALALPSPARVRVSTLGITPAAFRKLTQTDGTVYVTGTAFLFGKFKKFGFNFRRVVPIKVALTIPNPFRG